MDITPIRVRRNRFETSHAVNDPRQPAQRRTNPMPFPSRDVRVQQSRRGSHPVTRMPAKFLLRFPLTAAQSPRKNTCDFQQCDVVGTLGRIADPSPIIGRAHSEVIPRDAEGQADSRARLLDRDRAEGGAAAMPGSARKRVTGSSSEAEVVRNE